MKSVVVVRRQVGEVTRPCKYADGIVHIGWKATYFVGHNQAASVLDGLTFLGVSQGRDAWIGRNRFSKRRMDRLLSAMGRKGLVDTESLYREFERFLVRVAAVNGIRLVIEEGAP